MRSEPVHSSSWVGKRNWIAIFANSNLAFDLVTFRDPTLINNYCYEVTSILSTSFGAKHASVGRIRRFCVTRIYYIFCMKTKALFFLLLLWGLKSSCVRLEPLLWLKNTHKNLPRWVFSLSRFGLAVRLISRGSSVRIRLASPFSSKVCVCGLWTLLCGFVPHN